MLEQKTVLTLFRDREDAFQCASLLAGIPDVIRAVAGSEPATVLEHLKMIGIEPCLCIITCRLYPEKQPRLVATIREIFPLAEILLISSANEPFPPLHQLAADRVRHLAINPAGSPEGWSLDAKCQFFTAVTKMCAGIPWEIADYVKSGTTIHEFAVSGSAQKELLISMIEQTIGGDSPMLDILRQRAALLVDEMLENALYGAPRGEGGEILYQKGERRDIQPEEKILFRYGFDGETLAMEVADGWGTLSPDLVVDYLARNQNGEHAYDEGGRGLFIIWRFLDHFHVSIKPGRETVIGGHVRVTSPLDPDTPKGFHISAHL